MTFAAMVFTILSGAAFLGWAYYSGGYLPVALGLAALSLLWLLAEIRKFLWASSVGLLVLILAAAAGSWLGLPLDWILAGAVCALAAWDLANFRYRLLWASPGEDVRGLEWRHFVRLGVVLVIGVLLSAAASTLNARFSFGWAVLLGFVGVWGVSLLVMRLRREE